MTKQSKIFVFILIMSIIISIAIISIILANKNNINSDDTFVKQHLLYLDEGASDIVFLDVTLYFSKDDAFLEINYDYSYLGIERQTRYLVNRYTGQIVNGGYEDNYPEFMNNFNAVKANYTQKKVYSMADINRLLDK